MNLSFENLILYKSVIPRLTLLFCVTNQKVTNTAGRWIFQKEQSSSRNRSTTRTKKDLSDRYQLLKNEIDRPTKGPTLLMWVSRWVEEEKMLSYNSKTVLDTGGSVGTDDIAWRTARRGRGLTRADISIKSNYFIHCETLYLTSRHPPYLAPYTPLLRLYATHIHWSKAQPTCFSHSTKWKISRWMQLLRLELPITSKGWPI